MVCDKLHSWVPFRLLHIDGISLYSQETVLLVYDTKVVAVVLVMTHNSTLFLHYFPQLSLICSYWILLLPAYFTFWHTNSTVAMLKFE